MIQRIQTVFLGAGALGLVVFLFFDVIWSGAAAASQGWFTPLVVALAGLAAAVALWAIFLYNDRRRQRNIIVLAQGVTVLLMLALYGGLYLGNALFVRTAQGIDVALLAMLLLPVVAYVLFLLARRAVEKDIELVRSMDRLR